LQPARFYRGEHFTDFLNIRVRIPYPPVKYVKRIFGPDWRIPSKDKKKSRTPRKRISIEKYVKYFLEKKETVETND
jgi:hypothetical protein